jgi:hypothetical protein
MNTTKQTFVICIILGTIGLLTFAGTVEAGLRAEDITGAVEYALTDALQWQPLTREVVLVAGNHIRTGKNGAVGLKGDDGSVLYLEKDTRLAIAALEFSKADQKRISHFKLFQGKLTAKAAVVNFEQDAFKIETNTVVTQFRFPSLTISEPVTESPAQNAGAETVATVVVPQTATSSASSQIFPVEGDFDLQQKNTGETQVIMKVSSDAGVKFSMLKQDSLTTVGIQNKRQKVWVKSDHPLSKMSFFTDHVYNTVRVTNRENSHQCEGLYYGTGFIIVNSRGEHSRIFCVNHGYHKCGVCLGSRSKCSARYHYREPRNWTNSLRWIAAPARSFDRGTGTRRRRESGNPASASTRNNTKIRRQPDPTNTITVNDS